MNQEFATNLPNEEPSMEEPIDQQPSAPPLVNMDVVAGYDKMNGKDCVMCRLTVNAECSFI